MKNLFLQLILCLFFVHSYAQHKVFVLPNGVEIEGNWTQINNDSITIQTKKGQFMVFPMKEVVQKPTNETHTTLFQKEKPWFIGCHLGFQFGANDVGLWQGVGAEIKVFHRFRYEKQRFLYGKTGIEAVNGYQPALLIPVMAGFQASVLKKTKHHIYLFSAVGYGFADTETQEIRGQTSVSASGSARWEAGVNWLIFSGKESAFSIGFQYLFQKATFLREFSWGENVIIENQYKRAFINIGMMF